LEKLKERDYIKLEWIRETIETPDFKEEFSPWEGILLNLFQDMVIGSCV